jgi:hypothetical protein
MVADSVTDTTSRVDGRFFMPLVLGDNRMCREMTSRDRRHGPHKVEQTAVLAPSRLAPEHVVSEFALAHSCSTPHHHVVLS